MIRSEHGVIKRNENEGKNLNLFHHDSHERARKLNRTFFINWSAENIYQKAANSNPLRGGKVWNLHTISTIIKHMWHTKYTNIMCNMNIIFVVPLMIQAEHGVCLRYQFSNPFVGAHLHSLGVCCPFFPLNDICNSNRHRIHIPFSIK